MVSSARLRTMASLLTVAFLSRRRRWMTFWPNRSFSQIRAISASGRIKPCSSGLTMIAYRADSRVNSSNEFRMGSLSCSGASNSSSASRRPSDSTENRIRPLNRPKNRCNVSSGSCCLASIASSGSALTGKLIRPAFSSAGKV